MSLMAQFVDGQFQTSTSADSIKNSKKNDSGVTSEAFLQLLVAEMQNQDPLEPTSNTEWISQYATFTEVSEIQEIADAMDKVKAQDLVGEYVIMKVTKESTGETDYVSGKVDYVFYENDDVFLSINGENYSIKDLDTVADQKYMDANSLAAEVKKQLSRLPDVSLITLGDKAAVESLYEKVQNMSEYEKGFLSNDSLDAVDAYYNRLMGLLESVEDKTETAEDKASDTQDETDDKTSAAGDTDAAEQSDDKEGI